MARARWAVWLPGTCLLLSLVGAGCTDPGDGDGSQTAVAEPTATPTSPGETATPSPVTPGETPTQGTPTQPPAPSLSPGETATPVPSPTPTGGASPSPSGPSPTPIITPTPRPDADGDGIPDGDDCAPEDPDIHPGAPEEDCTDPTDYDCDGEVAYGDADGDGTADCEDQEDCDGLDNDGDSKVDEGVLTAFFPDADGDDYGAEGSPVYACAAPEGAIPVGGDCDDDDPKVNPGEEEPDCTDPTDYNCDGLSPFADTDGDGLADCIELEDCDGLDNDGDGSVDEGEGLCVCAEPSPGAEVVPALETCRAEPQVGGFSPVVEWAVESFPIAPLSDNVMMTPIALPLTDDNGDGRRDGEDVPGIVFVTYEGTAWTGDGVLRAYRGDGSGELFTVTGTGLQATGALAGGDLDGDGAVEIVGLSTLGELVAFDRLGAELWRSDPLPLPRSTYSHVPALADLEGDGEPEIILGNIILNSEGALKGQGLYGSGAAGGLYGTAAAIGDVDLDGVQEVVVGNAAYGPRGQALYFNGLADGPVALGNFDADPFAEVVVVAGGKVRLQEHTGAVIWSKPLPSEGGSYGGPPTVADFDGDGLPEIGVANFGTYVVFDTDGEILWTRPTTDNSSGVTGSAVFDFEGDGVAEVIYADEVRLWAFSGPDGSVKLEADSHTNWTVVEYAPIADVDGDGQAEIIVPNGLHPSYPEGARAGIVIIGDAAESWRPARRIWNQHAYDITNIEDDGTIPRRPEPSWLTWNAFRSGDITQSAGEGLPDLFPRVEATCTRACALEQLTLWVRLGNQGSRGVLGDVPIRVLADVGGARVSLGEVTISGPHLPGVLGDAFEIDVDLSLLQGAPGPLFIVADDDPRGGGGVAVECDEANNQIILALPCPR